MLNFTEQFVLKAKESYTLLANVRRAYQYTEEGGKENLQL